MIRVALKFAGLIAAVLLLSGAALSLTLYGSVEPCTMLAEERARRARDAAEEAVGAETGSRTLQEAAREAAEVASLATGEVAEAATEARVAVDGMEGGECARELWSTWF